VILPTSLSGRFAANSTRSKAGRSGTRVPELEVPPGYSDAVADYFRRLSKKK
jgi:hypothetical protein